MNKSQLLDLVKKNLGDGATKAQADIAVKATIQGVVQALEIDDTLQIIGFGSFMVKERKARKGRNPSTGENMDIPATKAITFKPGKALKERINAVKAKKNKK